ncbi:FTR1 family protein [Candidatus Peribacteria bacterium]|nr:FTR1 family protein [Candidatus Peribacteria bacterium]
MGTSLLITLRETFEASLIVGIMLAFLNRTQNREHNPVIWAGVGAGILTSLSIAAWILHIGASFEGEAEELYEGVMMLIAAGLILWMVTWLARNGKQMHAAIEQKMAFHLETGALLSLFLLVYTSVLREGLETVIFLQAAFFQSQSLTQNIGAIAGIVIAIGMAWLLFRGMLKWFPLGIFFKFSGILLTLFAISLIVEGVEELL